MAEKFHSLDPEVLGIVEQQSNFKRNLVYGAGASALLLASHLNYSWENFSWTDPVPYFDASYHMALVNVPYVFNTLADYLGRLDTLATLGISGAGLEALRKVRKEAIGPPEVIEDVLVTMPDVKIPGNSEFDNYTLLQYRGHKEEGFGVEDSRDAAIFPQQTVGKGTNLKDHGHVVNEIRQLVRGDLADSQVDLNTLSSHPTIRQLRAQGDGRVIMREILVTPFNGNLEWLGKPFEEKAKVVPLGGRTYHTIRLQIDPFMTPVMRNRDTDRPYTILVHRGDVPTDELGGSSPGKRALNKEMADYMAEGLAPSDRKEDHPIHVIKYETKINEVEPGFRQATRGYRQLTLPADFRVPRKIKRGKEVQVIEEARIPSSKQMDRLFEVQQRYIDLGLDAPSVANVSWLDPNFTVT